MIGIKGTNRATTQRHMRLMVPVFGLFSCVAGAQTAIRPATMPKIGEVSPRHVSYNIEAVEVTGGHFWKPYGSEVDARLAGAAQQRPSPEQAPGIDPSLLQYRAPIDLRSERLRKLAAALAPAYIRVSGTWRNSTFFQNDSEPPMKIPPRGFNSVMTRTQWKDVVDFANLTGAEIVASVATSTGTRDSDGVWTSEQAKSFFDYTKSIGGHIAATEFMNEPTFAVMGGAPRNYDATAFAKDVKIFSDFLRRESPGTIFLGPGSIGEGVPMVPGFSAGPAMLKTEDLLKATGPVFDGFSYHFYETVSRRCIAALGPKAGLAPQDALKREWLDRNTIVEDFYAKLRDAYLPGKLIWLTETGEGACGGDKFAAQFVDSFRYLDQLGTLARKGVQTVMYNTLASSDYGLLDEDTLEPRPNYWAALLWSSTMGVRVLDPGLPSIENLQVFAQCSKETRGGVTLVVLNMDATAEHTFTLPVSGKLYSLSAPDLFGKSVLLNGVNLRVNANGSVPPIKGRPIKAGELLISPMTINFVTLSGAKNASCM